MISYDALNRLVQVAEGLPVAQGGVPIPVEDYAYDGEGNRTASHLSAVYASNDHNQLLEDDTYTYAYDAKGNRISRTAKGSGAVETYTYDSQNRLVGYAGSTTATYAYDALDRRIAKTVDGVVEAFVYDSMDLGDSTASNATLTFRAGQLIKRWLFGPKVDEPLAFEGYTTTTAPGTGSVIELLANRLGSIITAISVSTGAVAAEYDYDSFGTRTQTGVLEQPYGFTGREHDAESGLMHYRARVYDPAAGVFLQSDPIGFESGLTNLHSYVGNDVHNVVDPSGLTGVVAFSVRAAQGAAGANASVWFFNSAVGFLLSQLIIDFNQIVAQSRLAPVASSGSDVSVAGGAGPGDEDPQCKSLREKIENLLNDIKKRELEILVNPGNLPIFGPGPNYTTVQGHRRIVNRLWKNLSNRQDQYYEKCR